MPLATAESMLNEARESQYAIGAFNVENMEMVMAVLEAAGELKAPVILQTTPSTVKYATADIFAGIAAAAAKKQRIPVALHLDHGNSYELAMKALQGGYTSVMIDGSGLPFEDNIKLLSLIHISEPTRPY